MKTAIDQAIESLVKTASALEWPYSHYVNIAIEELQSYKQTELDQLRAAYNNSCHDISFDEYYRNKYERKEQISPKDMGDNKEAQGRV